MRPLGAWRKGLALGAGALLLGAIFVTTRALYPKSVASPAPREGGARVVAATRVERADLARTMTLSAEFQPYQDVDVHAKVSGYVRSIRVDVGDHVKAGDTLAVLELPEMTDNLSKATAGARAAGEEIKRAQAHHDEIHAASERLVEVARQRPELVAGQDVDAAKAQDQAAEAALSSARHRMEESQANERLMRTMLDYGVITAPFSGVIRKRYADTGSLIQAGTSGAQTLPVVSLAEDRLLRLRFPVPESAVAFVREGTPVSVEVPALNRTFEGRVARFSGHVERATRSMETEVDVRNDDLRLTPGMYASVVIVLERRPNVLCVPVQAVVEGRSLVVGAGSALEARDVHVGLETPDRLEVISGLKEGELVVVGGEGQLRAGDHVVAKIPEGSAHPGEGEGRP